MILESARQAREFLQELATIIRQRNTVDAINPISRDKNPFRLLNMVGPKFAQLLEMVIHDKMDGNAHI